MDVLRQVTTRRQRTDADVLVGDVEGFLVTVEEAEGYVMLRLWTPEGAHMASIPITGAMMTTLSRAWLQVAIIPPDGSDGHAY